MAIVTGIFAGLTWMMALQATLFVYSIQRQRSLAKKMAAMQDAQKGFELNTEGDAAVVPIVYGRNLIGGHRVWVKTKSDYSHSGSSDPAFDSFNNGLSDYSGGSKNEYLFLQQVLSHGEIHKVYDILIQGDRVYNHADFNYGLRVNIHKAGSYADEMITTNFSDRSSSVFHKLAYASAVFKLNRDDPQYQGIPDLQYLVEGIKVKSVERNGSVGNYTYSLSSNKVYSNNPALCVLDYLLSVEYGKGLSTTEVDLGSFYNAAQLCARVVQSGVATDGKIWKPTNGSRAITTRNLPLYECNLTLDPTQPVRENLEVLLETMNGAELVWSGGSYKLILHYPELNQEIAVSGEITDNDIIPDNITIAWPSASERLNFVTVKFKNEALDFKEDTVSWPPKTGAVYSTFKAQDNNVPLERETFDTGIKDKYHALAKAEEQVRRSRELATYQFKSNISNSLYEPGDIIKLNSNILKVTNEYIQLSEIKLNSDNTVSLSGYRFVPEVFAWNAKDDEVVNVPSTFNFSISPPSNIQFTTGYEDALTYSVGTLTWDPPVGESPDSYIVEKLENGSYTYLGTAAGSSFEIYNLKSGNYFFTVRSRSNLGRLSARRVSKSIYIDDGTKTLPSIVLSDEIVAFAGQIDSRLNIDIVNPEPLFFGGYEVDARKQGDGPWKNVGSGKSTRFSLNGVEDGVVYEVRARVINALGAYSLYTQGQRLVLGKTAPPSDVLTFIASQQVSGVLLRWSAVPDPDIKKYVIRQGFEWDTATTIVETSELSYTIPPVSSGVYTWLIKAVDTSGNESTTQKGVSLTVLGPTAIQGASTELTDGLLTLRWEQATSQYPITDYLVRLSGEVVAELKSTRYSLQINWSGQKVFYVSGRDASGQEGPQVSIPFTVDSPVKPTGFRTTVIDNNILFYWNAVRGTLPTKEYLLKKGNTLDTAIDIGTTRGLFSTYFEAKAGEYTYWIAAVDIAGNIGEYAQLTTVVSAPPDYELAVDYYTDFSSSSKLNMQLVGEDYIMPVVPNQSWTDHFVSAGKTNIAQFVSDGYTIFVQPGINMGSVDAYYEESYALGTTLRSMMARISLTGEVLSGAPVVKTYLSTSEDGITYTEYEETNQLFVSVFSHIRFKVVVDNVDDKGIFLLRNINIVLDAKLKSDAGIVECIATDTEGTTAVFKQSFIDVTSISVTAKGTTPAIAMYDFNDAVNPTSFKVLLFNTSGVRINGTVSWTVKGY